MKCKACEESRFNLGRLSLAGDDPKPIELVCDNCGLEEWVSAAEFLALFLPAQPAEVGNNSPKK